MGRPFQAEINASRRHRDDPDRVRDLRIGAFGKKQLDDLARILRCFDLNTAKAVTELRQDKLVRRRMEELGAKADEGSLSPEEEREYDALIVGAESS